MDSSIEELPKPLSTVASIAPQTSESIIGKIKHSVGYVKARLAEKSTWGFITAGIAGASVLPRPWSYFSMGSTFIMSMIPDGKDSDAK